MNDTTTWTATTPTSVLDQLRLVRECATEQDERLRREGHTDLACEFGMSLSTLDAIILTLEDAQADVARWRGRAESARRWQFVLAVTLLVLSVAHLLTH